jgi:hypothetical protein
MVPSLFSTIVPPSNCGPRPARQFPDWKNQGQLIEETMSVEFASQSLSRPAAVAHNFGDLQHGAVAPGEFLKDRVQGWVAFSLRERGLNLY